MQLGSVEIERLLFGQHLHGSGGQILRTKFKLESEQQLHHPLCGPPQRERIGGPGRDHAERESNHKLIETVRQRDWCGFRIFGKRVPSVTRQVMLLDAPTDHLRFLQ